MEVYVLDSQLRRVEVIDRFESLIWTERWGAFGDFELVIFATPEMQRLLVANTKLAMNESDRVMTIDKATRSNNTDGAATITIVGRSMEYILEDRVATEGLVGLTDDKDWVLTGTPGNIVRYMFEKICVEGILSTADKIPFYKAGTIYPTETLDEPAQVITVNVPIGSLYKAIKDICDIYGLGFRLVRNLDYSEVYFNVYTGSDLTAQQSSRMPVIFSPDLDNLNNITEVTSVEGFKNVAYVFTKHGSMIVYANGVDPSSSGFQRRVLLVDATNVEDADGPALNAIMLNKGLDALATSRSVFAFDGEIPQSASYKYGQHYRLGDIVEMRTEDGSTNNMRVTEQIFVSDTQGERSYPTLALDQFIMPGTWKSWNFSDVWSNVNGTWADA